MRWRYLSALPFALLLVACSEQANIDQIQSTVATGIESQTELSGVVVNCPSEVDWEPGESFKCVAIAGADRVRVVIDMQKNGEFIWSAE